MAMQSRLAVSAVAYTEAVTVVNEMRVTVSGIVIKWTVLKQRAVQAWSPRRSAQDEAACTRAAGQQCLATAAP